MWDPPKRWARKGVIAENDDEAFDFFDIKEGDRPFYSLRKRPYSGSKKSGTRILF